MKRESFNDGWKFGKQGEEKRKVFLPHDAMQLEQRSADAKGESAWPISPELSTSTKRRWRYLPTGKGSVCFCSSRVSIRRAESL